MTAVLDTTDIDRIGRGHLRRHGAAHQRARRVAQQNRCRRSYDGANELMAALTGPLAPGEVPVDLQGATGTAGECGASRCH